jgi:hypothetical protein
MLLRYPGALPYLSATKALLSIGPFTMYFILLHAYHVVTTYDGRLSEGVWNYDATTREVKHHTRMSVCRILSINNNKISTNHLAFHPCLLQCSQFAYLARGMRLPTPRNQQSASATYLFQTMSSGYATPGPPHNSPARQSLVSFACGPPR